VIDYLAGAFLIAAPWLFGFSTLTEPRLLFLIAGVVLIAYSLLTKTYFSVARWIPLGAHMTLDTVLGIALILAPSLLSYRTRLTEGQYVAHVVIGIGLVGFVALTRPRTEGSKSAVDRAAIQHDLPIRS
jgi:hypothetical protein